MTDRVYNKLIKLSKKTEWKDASVWLLRYDIPGYPAILYNKEDNLYFSADMQCSGITLKLCLERYEALNYDL